MYDMCTQYVREKNPQCKADVGMLFTEHHNPLPKSFSSQFGFDYNENLCRSLHCRCEVASIYTVRHQLHKYLANLDGQSILHRAGLSTLNFRLHSKPFSRSYSLTHPSWIDMQKKKSFGKAITSTAATGATPSTKPLSAASNTSSVFSTQIQSPRKDT